MAREYARVKVAIWADTDFRLLTDPAQALYFRLLSSPTMSLCGVADWRPNRIAALTAGMTPKKVREAAAELTANGYIVTDDDTEEVLVRSFVRHDGLIKTPNIAAAMCKDYAGTASALLRGVIVHELLRLHDEEPEMKGWATASKLLSEEAINPLGNPSPKASGMASPNPSGNESHIPQPSSLNQQPAATPAKRATRLPQGFAPNDSNRKVAQEHRVSLGRVLPQFIDHHEAKGSTFVDWHKALNTWIRREKPDSPLALIQGDDPAQLPPVEQSWMRRR